MSKIDVILDISNKTLSEVPKHVLEMNGLKMLYLESNNLEVIPDNLFTQLKKLVWLDLRSNKLKTLPQTIANHPCLETLLLRDNEIQILPLELGLVPNLKVLQISGNPIVYPKKEIIQEGIQSIITYLKLQYESTKLPLASKEFPNEIKLLVSNRHKKPKRKRRSSKENKDDSLKCSNPVLKIKNYQKESKCSLLTSHHKPFRNKICKTFSRGSSVYKDYPHHNSNKYLSHQPIRKNEVRVEEKHFKELWLQKLKEIMYVQDEKIQKDKNYETLKTWRQCLKPKQSKQYDFKKSIPYDYNEEYYKTPSRKDLQKSIEKTKKISKSQIKPRTPNIEKLISDMVTSLQVLGKERNSQRSPRSQMDKAGRDIKKIVELQKRLSMLKLVIAKDV